MPYKDPDYKKKWNAANKEAMSAKHKIWYAQNRESVTLRDKKRNDALKMEILSHYGRDGEAKCCWVEGVGEVCMVSDPDMLSLDHINNDGGKHRKTLGCEGGTAFYRMLKRKGLPAGYQTLCMNHQFKKASVARRGY